MCTVTLIALREAPGAAFDATAGAAPTVRLACNRDELRTRPPSLPPVVRACGAGRALMPIDPTSGGTWVGVSDAGLAATLLNVYSEPARATPAKAGLRSRGALVPAVLECGSMTQAVDVAASIRPREYPPFRLVMLTIDTVAELRSDGATLRLTVEPRDAAPRLYTSSGLGDQQVEAPRRELFDTMFASPGDRVAQQEAFHRHSWPDRRHLSVCMERADARTVSYTWVAIEPERVALAHTPGPPDVTAPLPTLRLPRMRSDR